MKIRNIMLISALMFLVVSVFVFAQKPDTRTAETPAGNTVIVPAHAVELAPGLFSLGEAKDVDGRIVQGFMFIDKKKENAKPGTVCGNGICEPGEKKSCSVDCGGGNGGIESSSCFSLFAKGAKWKTTEPYVLNTTNNDMTNAFVASKTELSLNEWDDEVAFDIFGSRDVSGITDGADTVTPDGKNEVEFQNLGADNTIAFAIVWGIFKGKPSERELVEWDVVFNDNFTFGDANSDPLPLMDYQNIATHEFGHSLGLTHPDDNSCTDETMYRFAAFNETKKRTLEAGDITGVNELY